MNQFKRILVAIDTRLKHHPIFDEAMEIAKQTGATIKLMDVVPEFPWIVRMTLGNHKEVQLAIENEKKSRLAELANIARSQNINVETHLASGKASTEIVQEVIRGKHDLALAVAKGESSGKIGFFGRTSQRLLRTCPCPLWLVAPGTTPKFKNILGCVETSTDNEVDAELNDLIYDLASSISDYHGGKLSILHTWSLWNERMLLSRMKSEDFNDLQAKSLEHESRLLDAFMQKHGASIDDANVHLFKGEPDEVISDFIRSEGIDLVVLGTVAKSGLGGEIAGNTSEKILGRIECSVLALKPSGFVSPIRLHT